MSFPPPPQPEAFAMLSCLLSRFVGLSSPVLAVVLMASPALAAPDLFASGSGPLEILADQGIEWQQGQNRFIARGNASATRGTFAIHADELVAYYRGQGATSGANSATGANGASGAAPTGPASDLRRVEAHGSVRITSATDTVTGSDAVYDSEQGKAVVTNAHGPVRLTTPKESVVAQKSLEYDLTRSIATATGGAFLQQGTRTLKADTLIAHMAQVGGKSELETVDAQNNVVITTEKEVARGSSGHYDARTGIATLSGTVTITRGESVLTGGQAMVNMKTGVSTLSSGGSSGRARAVLVPEKKTP